MTDVAAAARRTFSSLKIRNFRLYFTGQLISVSGTWMQGVAQAWLVLQLTGSGTALGITGALQTLPVLLLAPLGGVIADRFDKRRLLFATQSTASVLALLLGVLVIGGVVQLWMVYVLAFGFGMVVAVDNPTRQTFTLEMVGPDDLTNAVSLNSVMVNLGRVIGPAMAGILIAVVGLGPCFVLNGASYLGVIIALALMHTRELHRTGNRARGRGKLMEGFRYVRAHSDLWIPLAMMAVIGMLTYEFRVTLPLMAKFSFGGDAGTYALMTTFMGLGAVVGARRHHPDRLRGPQPDPRAGGAAPGRGGEHLVHRSRQRHAAAHRGTRDARSGHGVVDGRLPRFHPYRRANRRLARGAHRPPGRARDRRRRRPRVWSGGVVGGGSRSSSDVGRP